MMGGTSSLFDIDRDTTAMFLGLSRFPNPVSRTIAIEEHATCGLPNQVNIDQISMQPWFVSVTPGVFDSRRVFILATQIVGSISDLAFALSLTLSTSFSNTCRSYSVQLDHHAWFPLPTLYLARECLETSILTRDFMDLAIASSIVAKATASCQSRGWSTYPVDGLSRILLPTRHFVDIFHVSAGLTPRWSASV
jgi:hypothetical protein